MVFDFFFFGPEHPADQLPDFTGLKMSLGIDFPGYVNYLVEERNWAIEPATSVALADYRANINLFGNTIHNARLTQHFVFWNDSQLN